MTTCGQCADDSHATRLSDRWVWCHLAERQFMSIENCKYNRGRLQALYAQALSRAELLKHLLETRQPDYRAVPKQEE